MTHSRCQALIGAVALTLTLAMVACTGRTLDDEWAYTLEHNQGETLKVVDYLPRAGVPGVPKHIEPYFFFNKTLDLGDLDFVIAEAGAERDLGFSQQPDFDGLGLRFIPSEEVKPQAPNGVMAMDLIADPNYLINASEFLTQMPAGRYFNASTALECTRFGGDPSHAKQLNKYMEPGVYPLYVLFGEGLDAQTTFPTTMDLYLGPAYIRDNGQLRIFRHLGFTTPLPGTEIDTDGYFSYQQDGGFLPLDTPDGVVLLYLERMVVTGHFVQTGGVPEMDAFSMSGVVPTRFLRILADSSEGYSIVVGMLELDVDLNGNGSPDSATFAVRSRPTLLEADEYSP